MTTQTATSELPGTGASPLDVGELTRLAGAFFAALPGQAPLTTSHGGVSAPTNVLPGGTSLGPHANGPQLPGTIAPGANVVPTSPNSAANQVSSVPALVPHSAAPNGLPDNAAIVPPALDSRLGQISLAVPEGYAAAQPRSHEAPVSPFGAQAPGAPSSPYYFLGEASAYSAPSNTGSASPFYFVGSQPQGFANPPQSHDARRPPFDVNAIRRDFPILQERVNGKQLVWFDNAATTHKPQSVIDRISYFYQHENSNIHRAAHALAARATDAYEAAREKVRAFIGAGSVDEVIFVRGTTEAINLVAKTWGAANIGEGDEIIVSNLEHHANIVPWQQLAAAKGAKIRVIPVDDNGQVLLDEYRKLLNPRTKIVSVTQVSNALGTVVPVQEIVALAHAAGAKALVDGAQSVSHMRVNVQQLDADFFVFSGHKIFGPTGIGVVYGKRELLEDMPPWQGGGNMIADVTFERTLFQPPPNKFEAGTGNIADAVGLGAALDYVQRVGIENIARYEHDLLEYATHYLRPIPGVRLIGTAKDKASVLSFVLQGYTTEEVGKALNQEGIAVRTGHHCAQPILRRFGVETTVRPSLAFYNTCEEVDRFIAVIRRLSNSKR
jgi:cysteine desulfurase / selenocysteine lyase